MNRLSITSFVIMTVLMSSCGRAKTGDDRCGEDNRLPEWAYRLNEIPMPAFMQGDSLIDVYFAYKQTVNGYEVTGRWRSFKKMSETGPILLNFRNTETSKEYQYFSEKYHSYDTDKVSFANGFRGHQKGDLHYFNYTSPDTLDSFKMENGNSPLGFYSPFQFFDIDFDGKDELLISDWYQGQAGNGYEVFKMTDKDLLKLDYMPLDRLTNLDKIDLENKTITIVDFDGASDNASFFFSHKKREEIITDVPDFYSDCAKRFDFKKYNNEPGAPFVLNSIEEYAERDVEHHVSYSVSGNAIVKK